MTSSKLFLLCATGLFFRLTTGKGELLPRRTSLASNVIPIQKITHIVDSFFGHKAVGTIPLHLKVCLPNISTSPKIYSSMCILIIIAL